MALEKVLPLIVIFLAGYLLKRLGFFKKEDERPVGNAIVYLVAPVAITNAIWSVELEWSLMKLPVIAVIIVTILLFIGYLLARALPLKGKERGSFIISFPSLEGGTIGYAFMFAVFGELGLSRMVLFDFGNAVWEFTVLFFVAYLLGQGDVPRGKAVLHSLKQAFKTPLLWAPFIGLALNLGNVESAFLENLFDLVGVALPALVMVLLALIFEPKELKSFRIPAIAIPLKFAAGFLVGLAMVEAFGLEGIDRTTVLVGATLPTSIMATVFAKQCGLDTKYVANLLVLALPLDVLGVMFLRTYF